MARSPDCLLRIESLSWHSGTPVTTIGGAIQSGELPATKRPRRVKAADFEAWLERQAMDGGKRYKRRDELARWRSRYPEGEAAPLESYPVAEAPAPAPQLELVADAPPTEPDFRDMLGRVLFGMEVEGLSMAADEDICDWWEGARDEFRLASMKRMHAEMAEEIAKLERRPPRPHGALTDAEIASLEAA